MPNLEILPNSLTKTPKVDMNLSRNGVNWFYLFCANCGTEGGRVMETDIPNADEFAFYLCIPCSEKYGHVPNMMNVPDEVFWQKVREAQMERYGRELEPQEQIRELDSSDSMLSKLAKDRRALSCR